jgi:plastocyanin
MIRTLATLAAALALALAGCGGDDEPSSGSGGSAPSGGGQQLALAAPEDGSLSFDPAELTAKAGTVTVNFDNPSTAPHAVQIEGNGVDEASDTVTGGKASVTADLEAGEYTFYCPVGNHRDGGMEGTLTVE